MLGDSNRVTKTYDLSDQDSFQLFQIALGDNV